MKRILCVVAAAAVGLTAGTVQAQGFTPDPKMNYKVLAFRAVETGKIEGVVASVDPAGRMLAVKGPSGTVRTVKAGKNIQGLEKINVEDRVIAEYYRSATFYVDKPGATPMAPELVTAFLAASKSNEVVEAAEVAAEGTATVSAIDKGAGTITFTGPGGRVFPVKVDNVALLDGISVGQALDFKVVDVVAFDVKVTPKPAPPPPPPTRSACQDKIKDNKVLLQENILFDVAKATIKPASYPIIDGVAAVMKACPDLKVRVEGHASKDPNSAKRGKAGYDYNMKLSDDRAKSVKAYLVEKDAIAADRLEAIGFGWNQPIFPNDTAANRIKNRRVDFVITN